MLTDPIASKKYDAAAVSLKKISSIPGYAKFALSTNSAIDITTVEIRYRADKPITRRAVDAGSSYAIQSQNKTFNVKVVHKAWNGTFGRWDTLTVNLTCTYDSGLDVVTSATLLKDPLAIACNIPLTSALFAQLVSEEV